jgi:hypothetical protein
MSFFVNYDRGHDTSPITFDDLILGKRFAELVG